MSKSTAARTATAADVRAFFRDEAKGSARMSSLKDATCVKPGARGRLSPEAIAAYNKGKTAARRYVTGNTGEVTASAKEAALNLRVAAFDKNVAVGQRGPLSNEARKALGLKPVSRKASAKA